jgi:Arylsulfotransferase (ASST)
LPSGVSPEDRPGLIDPNYPTSRQSADWLHINSIDYNEALNQIVLSVHHANEIWIIDHNTSTSEAAGSK